jgi:hypothetical protein
MECEIVGEFISALLLIFDFDIAITIGILIFMPQKSIYAVFQK